MLTIDRGRAVVEKRQILRLLVVRDLKVRYSRSALGYVWTVLDPLLMSCVYWLVFGVIFGGARGRDAPVPYIVFLVSGVLAWQWFSGAVNDMARALIQDAKLVRSTNLPREIWVIKIVLAKGVEFLLAVPVIAVFMVVTGRGPQLDALWNWPVAIGLQTVLLTGIGLALAPAAALVTDLQRVVRIVLRMMMYLSPVLYTVQQMPDKYHLRELIAFNPMTGILDLYRRGIFETEAPWHTVLASVGVCFGVLFLGMWIFRRLEPAVLKEI
jgi:ABC-2 type transport system permease protein